MKRILTILGLLSVSVTGCMQQETSFTKQKAPDKWITVYQDSNFTWTLNPAKITIDPQNPKQVYSWTEMNYSNYQPVPGSGGKLFKKTEHYQAVDCELKSLALKIAVYKDEKGNVVGNLAFPDVFPDASHVPPAGTTGEYLVNEICKAANSYQY